jgi:hypothetical protein
MTDRADDAVEAAGWIIANVPNHTRGYFVARALLSLRKETEEARKEERERCVDIVNELCEKLSDCSPAYVALQIEDRIRSLPSPPLVEGS